MDQTQSVAVDSSHIHLPFSFCRHKSANDKIFSKKVRVIHVVSIPKIKKKCLNENFAKHKYNVRS